MKINGSWDSVLREERLKMNDYHTMGFMVLDPNNDRGHQIDGVSEKGQEYQAVRIFGKDNLQF